MGKQVCKESSTASIQQLVAKHRKENTADRKPGGQ